MADALWTVPVPFINTGDPYAEYAKRSPTLPVVSQMAMVFQLGERQKGNYQKTGIAAS